MGLYRGYTGIILGLYWGSCFFSGLVLGLGFV